MQEVLSDAGHLDELLLRASSSGGSFQGPTQQQQQQQQVLPNSIPSADGRASAASPQPATVSFSDAATAASAKGDVSPSQVTVTNADSAAAAAMQEPGMRGSANLAHCISLAGGMAARQQQLTDEEAMELVEDELQQQQQQLPHDQQVQQQLLQLQELELGLRGRSGSGSGGGNAPAAAAAAAAAAALVSGGSGSTLQPQQQAAVDWYINKFYNSFKDKPLGVIGSCRTTEDLEDWATGKLQGRSSRADRHSTEDRDKQTSFEEWRAAYQASRPNSGAGAAGGGAAAAAADGRQSATGRFSTVSGAGNNSGTRKYDSLDGGGSIAISDAEAHPTLHDRTTQDTLFGDFDHFGKQQQQQQQGAGQHRTTQETLLEGDIEHLVLQQQQQQHGHGLQHHVGFIQPSAAVSLEGSGGSQAAGSAAGTSEAAAAAAAAALLEQLKIAEVSVVRCWICESLTVLKNACCCFAGVCTVHVQWTQINADLRNGE
jgi:hypothetical protein